MSQLAYDNRQEPCNTPEQEAREAFVENEANRVMSEGYEFITRAVQHGNGDDVELLGNALLSMNKLDSKLGDAVYRTAIDYAEHLARETEE